MPGVFGNNPLNPCSMPFSQLEAYAYDLAMRGLSFINPFHGLNLKNAEISAKIGGCLDYRMSMTDIFAPERERNGGYYHEPPTSLRRAIGEQKYAEVLETRNSMREFTLPVPPAGFPHNFLDYFPDGFQEGFAEDFANGLPDGCGKWGLPKSFEDSFRLYRSKVYLEDMSPRYKEKLGNLAIRPIEGKFLYNGFISRGLPYTNAKEVSWEEKRWLELNGVPANSSAIFNDDYVRNLVDLIHFVPPGGFKLAPVDQADIYRVPGFNGFSSEFLRQVNSDYFKFNKRSEYLAGSNNPPNDLENGPHTFDAVYGPMQQSLRISEALNPSMTKKEARDKILPVFGVLLLSGPQALSDIETSLGYASEVFCGANTEDFLSNIFNDFHKDWSKVYKNILKMALNEFAGITTAHLANLALSQILSRMHFSLEINALRINPLEEVCGAFEDLANAITSPQMSNLLSELRPENLIPSGNIRDYIS